MYLLVSHLPLDPTRIGPIVDHDGGGRVALDTRANRAPTFDGPRRREDEVAKGVEGDFAGARRAFGATVLESYMNRAKTARNHSQGRNELRGVVLGIGEEIPSLLMRETPFGVSDEERVGGDSLGPSAVHRSGEVVSTECSWSSRQAPSSRSLSRRAGGQDQE